MKLSNTTGTLLGEMAKQFCECHKTTCLICNLHLLAEMEESTCAPHGVVGCPDCIFAIYRETLSEVE